MFTGSQLRSAARIAPLHHIPSVPRFGRISTFVDGQLHTVTGVIPLSGLSTSNRIKTTGDYYGVVFGTRQTPTVAALADTLLTFDTVTMSTTGHDITLTITEKG